LSVFVPVVMCNTFTVMTHTIVVAVAFVVVVIAGPTAEATAVLAVRYSEL